MTRSGVLGWLGTIGRHPSAVLLAVQLLAVVVYPFMDASPTGRAMFSLVVPVLPQARSLVMIEQVGGLMYVALVISRIVGLTLYRERA